MIVLSLVGTLVPPNVTTPPIDYVLLAGAGPDFQFHTMSIVDAQYITTTNKVAKSKMRAHGVSDIPNFGATTGRQAKASLTPVRPSIMASIVDPDQWFTYKQILSRFHNQGGLVWTAAGSRMTTVNPLSLTSFADWLIMNQFMGYRGGLVLRLIADAGSSAMNTTVTGVSTTPFGFPADPQNLGSFEGCAFSASTEPGTTVALPHRSPFRIQTMDSAFRTVGYPYHVMVNTAPPGLWTAFLEPAGGTVVGTPNFHWYMAAGDDFSLTTPCYGGDLTYYEAPPTETPIAPDST